MNLYKNLYTDYGNITPLYFDCGQLCNQKCCQNNGKGMILFPHEKEYLDTIDNDYTVLHQNDMDILYCSGSCNRQIRPLSCIIFPLFPFLYEDGRLDIRMDPRARNLCPLYFEDIKELTLQPLFRIKLFKLFYQLIAIEDFSIFLKKMTMELLSIEKFIK